MSTRSKAKLAAASTSKVIAPASPKTEQKPKKNQQEKDNIKGRGTKAGSKTPSVKRKSLRLAPPVYCTCQKGDDGTPMVHCEECKVWYHFGCVDLTEDDAEDINVYVCPSCAKTSGRRTAMLWEGPDAVEQISDAESSIAAPVPTKQSIAKRLKRDNPTELPSESEEDPSSADEYVVESKPTGKVGGKRQTRRLSFSSESDSEASDGPKQSRRSRPRKPSASPPPSALKRKNHHASHTPPAKRKKSDASNATDDPARKYCLTKLEELFRDIFFRYPHVRVESQDGDDHDKAHEKTVVQKPLDDMTDEEKAVLADESKQFATELEKCVFEIYSEPDKNGNPHAGSNYKDRFRMLQFNLSKVDRVVIHQRISSAMITPKEISLMSSTDLANEETKQSIKIAEKEALAYSILTPTAVPRAKITHKGLEDIEDIHDGEVTSLQEEERSRREEEARRERERTARLRAQTRQRTTSVSVPPESPTVSQHNHTWGGPPPVPMHAILSGEATASSPTTFTNERSPVNPSFASDLSMEPELNLADFINMDDEVPSTGQPATKSVPLLSPSDQPSASEATATSDSTSPPSPIVPTGLSPFAAKADHPRSASFDLDALWNAPKPEESTTPTSSPLPQTKQLTPDSLPVDKDVAMELDAAEADDQDFDMFLDEKDLDPSQTSPEAQQAALDALPQVWTGKITMPLDSTLPQETPVVARQIGGRHLGHDSVLWKTLFPSELLRIDGRVPVDNSCKFLLQMRMNVTKELIAVAFAPASESNDIGFRILSDFLMAKGRHGLVFPWGNRPKDHHPGRELYIIPLLSSDPLPDYMELLDDLHLPKVRKSNLLIGIWVLNKGKLAPPPPPPPSQVPAFLPIPPNDQLPIPNSLAPYPPAPPSVLPQPLAANIAAEVASLTPEQIQLMIQTLTRNGSIPLPVPQPAPPQVMPQAPHLPVPAPPPQQPWSNPAHNYGAMYPPQNIPLHHNPPPPPPHSSYNYHDSRSQPGNDYDDHGGRGWRGRGRGGRGRGNDSPKPVDSGWPRRPRNDNGGPGPSSPTRRW